MYVCTIISVNSCCWKRKTSIMTFHLLSARLLHGRRKQTLVYLSEHNEDIIVFCFLYVFHSTSLKKIIGHFPKMRFVCFLLQLLLSSVHRVDHYGDIEMDPGYAILPDTTLDPSGRYIYSISSNKVLHSIASFSPPIALFPSTTNPPKLPSWSSPSFLHHPPIREKYTRPVQSPKLYISFQIILIISLPTTTTAPAL